MRKHQVREVWAERVRQWQASGLTVEAFAAQIGVKPDTLKRWPRRLSETAGVTGNQPSFVEIVGLCEKVRSDALGSTNNELAVGRANARERFEVCVGEHLRIVIPSQFEGGELRRLLDAVRGY